MQGITRRNLIKGVSMAPLVAGLGSLSAAPRANKPHVAVIGAGAFGGWTALHLLRMGAKVTLLDAWGAGNSRSSSGGESRVIRGIYGTDRTYVEWVTRSFELWKQNQTRWNVPLYHRTGLLWMFVKDDSYARDSLPLAREFGLQIDRLERSDAKRSYPQIDFDGVQSLYFEHEAGYLKARHACQVVAQQFQIEGGEVRQVSVRPGAIRSGNLEQLDLSDGSHFAADQYVFACGPWLGRLFGDVLGKYITPSRQEAYYFGAPTGNTSFKPGNLPVWVDFDERLYYGFPSIDGRGFKIADDTRGEAFDPTDGDRTPSPEGIARAKSFLARRFPQLKNAPLVEARVCQYENSPDGHLIVDRHPEAQNTWFAGGGSGHGFKLGPAVGEHVAQCVLNLSEPLPFFSMQRLAKLKGKSTQFDKKQ